MAAKGGQINQNGTVFTVVGTNRKADHVWWIRNGVLYWVSNTLSYTLDKQELVRMAESFISVARP